MPTLQNIPVTPQWQSLNALSGIANGSNMRVVNLMPVPCRIKVADTMPTDDSGYKPLGAGSDLDKWLEIAATGSEQVWIRSVGNNGLVNAEGAT